MSPTVDLNADLGEGFAVWQLGDDEAMLAVVTSANLACGFHAGDPALLLRTCRAAAEAGVRVGAQVSYRDLAGFGRRFIDVTAEDLTADVIYQIGALQAIAHAAGTTVSYVKPHGALYNTIVHHEAQARAVVDAVQVLDAGLPLVTLPGSTAARLATDAGIRVVAEGFADRGYRPDGSLTPRGTDGALLTDTDEICARTVRMVTAGEVVAVDGSVVPVEVDSICLHGDTPGAVEHARAVASALADARVQLRSFLA